MSGESINLPGVNDHKELAQELNALYDEIDHLHRSKFHAEIKFGERLLAAKETVGHRLWMAWVERNCKFKIRTAEYKMELARNYREVPELHDKLLTLDMTNGDARKFLKKAAEKKQHVEVKTVVGWEKDLYLALTSTRRAFKGIKGQLTSEQWSEWCGRMGWDQTLLDDWMDSLLPAQLVQDAQGMNSPDYLFPKPQPEGGFWGRKEPRDDEVAEDQVAEQHGDEVLEEVIEETVEGEELLEERDLDAREDTNSQNSQNFANLKSAEIQSLADALTEDQLADGGVAEGVVGGEQVEEQRQEELPSDEQ